MVTTPGRRKAEGAGGGKDCAGRYRDRGEREEGYASKHVSSEISAMYRHKREDRIQNNYLCTSKYYNHVYNFFRRANPLQGGLGQGTLWALWSHKASVIWGPQMSRGLRPNPPSI